MEDEGQEQGELIFENPVYARPPPSLLFQREILVEEMVVAHNITRRSEIVSGITQNGDYVAFSQTTFVLNVSLRDENRKVEEKEERKPKSNDTVASAAAAA